MHKKIYQIDRIIIGWMDDWGVLLLRLSLGLVFLWFGLLKLLDVSPVEEIILKSFPFLPYPWFFYFLGILEVCIGLGLLFKFFLRLTLVLLVVQLIGTFISMALKPALFFQTDHFLYLTMEGEFVIKNLVLLAAGIVIGGQRLPLLKKIQ